MSNILAGTLDTCDDSSRYGNVVPSSLWQNEFAHPLDNFFGKTNKLFIVTYDLSIGSIETKN